MLKEERADTEPGFNAPDFDPAILSWFPVRELAPVSTLESWRKEVHRPIYHAHKWWATRLGSVFRAILLATLSPAGTARWEQFYKPVRFPGRPIVLDPFMGSGTTLGEGLKLECRVVGCDINPIATFQVRKAIEAVDLHALRGAFERLAERVARPIAASYATTSAKTGLPATSLYTFWVMTAPCTACGAATRLFDSYIFAQHAYPKRFPSVHVLCACCGAVFEARHGDERAVCPRCTHAFDPRHGPVTGSRFTCVSCRHRGTIIDALATTGRPPQYEMYALRVLEADGTKHYQAVTQEDVDQYMACVAEADSRLPLPDLALARGYNTQQLLRYGIRTWRDIFTARQLQNLDLLLAGIAEEPDSSLREYLLLLFSGTLEFNNLLCSYKGEGTGAVRHAFSHHVLRPHRTPLEAQVWGTPHSSGSFSTLFESRLLRAKRYADHPFEIRVAGDDPTKAVKVPLNGARVSARLGKTFEDVRAGRADALVLNGDSARLPLPDASVDAVVTDPPYFDMVNYSELADLFYAWLRPHLQASDIVDGRASTRHEREVQSQDPGRFSERLSDVLAEARRVLKPGGPLVFTFHHSKPEAWVALAVALRRAGLAVETVHVVKAEMSVAQPKQQAKEPIDVDCVIAARQAVAPTVIEPHPSCVEAARRSIQLLNAAGVRMSLTDIRVVLAGQSLPTVTHPAWRGDLERTLDEVWGRAEALWKNQAVAVDGASPQLRLLEEHAGYRATD